MKKKHGRQKKDDFLFMPLTSHKQYLSLLRKLRSVTEKIVIVQIDGPLEKDPILEKAKQCMILEKKEIVSRWLGTVAHGREAVSYTFRADQAYFDYLATLEAFFLVEEGNGPYMFEETAFGSDDIAFLGKVGKSEEPLFFTTTHEGEAFGNRQLFPDGVI